MNEEAKWNKIEARLALFDELGMRGDVDHEKFYLYSIINHSTALGGSTLSERETRLLLDEGITVKRKPLANQLMNNDLHDAYVFAREQAEEGASITPEFLRELSALVMRSTGGVTRTMGGTFDSSKGEFRLRGIVAGWGGNSYVNYPRIPAQLAELCDELNGRLDKVKRVHDAYDLSFDAHLRLVTIYPWADGNGRVARLLMNYVQFYHGLFPARVYKKHQEAYDIALVESRKAGNNAPFRAFMSRQLLEALREETGAYERSRDGDATLTP
jgi:Fic family protein